MRGCRASRVSQGVGNQEHRRARSSVRSECAEVIVQLEPEEMLVDQNIAARIDAGRRRGGDRLTGTPAINVLLTTPWHWGNCIFAEQKGGTHGTHVRTPHPAARLRDLARPWPGRRQGG